MARLIIEGDKKYLDIINKKSRLIISKNGLSSKIEEKPKKGRKPKDEK